MQSDGTARTRGVSLWQGWLLLATMGTLLGLIGWTLAAGWGLLMAAACMLALTQLVPHVTAAMLLRIYGARPLAAGDLPALHGYIEAISRRAGLARMPNLYLLGNERPSAVAMGRPDDAAIAISDGLLCRVPARELAAILAHEIAHIAHHDLEIMGLADLFGRMTSMLSLAGQILLLISLPLWWLVGVDPPWPAILLLMAAPLISALSQLALSRTREYAADAEAIALTGDPQGLVDALRRLDALAVRSRWPLRWSPSGGDLLGSHPPTARRVRRLAAIAASADGTRVDVDSFPPID